MTEPTTVTRLDALVTEMGMAGVLAALALRAEREATEAVEARDIPRASWYSTVRRDLTATSGWLKARIQ